VGREDAPSGSGRLRRSASQRDPGVLSTRRGRRRSERLAGEVHEPEIQEEGPDSTASLDLVIRDEGQRGPRPAFPHGPRLRADFAADWDGVTLLLDPASHLSHRVISGLPLGNMRTFSGFTSALLVYETILSAGSRAFISGCAFGPLVDHWRAIGEAKPIANLVVLRAFLDRYWDTTTTFHMPGYEAGITMSSFAIISGLPVGDHDMHWSLEPPSLDSAVVEGAIGSGLRAPRGKERGTTLVKTTWIADFFEGKGRYPPARGSDEQNARLWLWWFLSATYFGEKGERAATSVLMYLLDWQMMGAYDWVSPALGLTIKYCRDAVRPDKMSEGSKPSLVFPGVIMEVSVFALLYFALRVAWCLL
jgi:Plant mobile domain